MTTSNGKTATSREAATSSATSLDAEATFAQRISGLRVSLGLSKVQFAKIFGRHSRTVKDWEDGKAEPKDEHSKTRGRSAYIRKLTEYLVESREGFHQKNASELARSVFRESGPPRPPDRAPRAVKKKAPMATQVTQGTTEAVASKQFPKRPQPPSNAGQVLKTPKQSLQEETLLRDFCAKVGSRRLTKFLRELFRGWQRQEQRTFLLLLSRECLLRLLFPPESMPTMPPARWSHVLEFLQVMDESYPDPAANIDDEDELNLEAKIGSLSDEEAAFHVYCLRRRIPLVGWFKRLMWFLVVNSFADEPKRFARANAMVGQLLSRLGSDPAGWGTDAELFGGAGEETLETAKIRLGMWFQVWRENLGFTLADWFQANENLRLQLGDWKAAQKEDPAKWAEITDGARSFSSIVARERDRLIRHFLRFAFGPDERRKILADFDLKRAARKASKAAAKEART